MVSITPLSRSLRPLTRLFFCLALALGSALLHADTLSASVDRSRLALDETLTLTLRFGLK